MGKMLTADEKSGRMTVWVSIAVNVFLIIIKFAVGIIARSQALIADAIHSFTDFVTDIMSFFGLKYAFKGEDHDHPFGHGKIDNLMSLLIGVALTLAGLWLGTNAILSLIHGGFESPSYVALIGALLSIIVKESLFHYQYRVGKRIGNQSLIANAWHHRSDVISSSAVLIGLIPAVISPGLAYFDALAAIVVSVFIVKIGCDIMIPAFRSASDAGPEKNEIEEIERVAASINGVRNAHDVRARYYSSKLYVEVHVVVDPEITVEAGHEIAVAVRKKIRHEVKNILDVMVHIDPDIKEWREPSE